MKPRNGPRRMPEPDPMPRKQQPSLSIGRKPSHRLYRVLGDGADANWTPIGAACPNKDGMGFCRGNQ